MQADEQELVDSHGSYRNRALSGFAWFFGTTVSQAVVHLATLVVLARLIAPRAFGVMAIGLIVVRIAEFFARAGIAAALVQSDAVDDSSEASAFALSLGSSLGLVVLVVLTAPFVAVFFANAEIQPVMCVLSVIFPIQSLAVVSEARLQRQLAFRPLALQNFASFAVGYAGVAVIGGIAGWGVWALVAGQIAKASIWAVLVIRQSPPRVSLSRVSRRSTAWIASFAARYAIGDAGNFLAVNADNLLIGRVLGVALVGYYSRAYQLMALPAQMIGAVLDKVLFPIQSAIQGDRERLSRQYLHVMTIALAILVPVGPMLSVVAEEVIELLFGARWTAAVPPFRVLAFVFGLRALYRVSEAMIRATGHLTERAHRQWLYAVAVAVGGLFGVPFGLTGVAIGVSFALAVHYISMLQLCRSILDVRWRLVLTAHLPAILISAVSYVLCVLAVTQLRVFDAAAIVIIATALSVAMFASVLALWLSLGRRTIVRTFAPLIGSS